ncbi:MAG: pyridoxal phosphate-dependent aminotransferase [Candidatus Bathyarchaeota archaeon]|nr:MAG: pyridoxal phosphate-dependent aminotransferase [Candidatus Bathyarchaeota archaeon]
MSPILAERMDGLGTETAFEVLAKAKALERQGREIVHLEIGEPDFDTPKNIRDAAIRALNSGYTHYVPAAGLPELRQAIAEHISKTRKIDVRPEEVVVTPGAKPIIFFSILACIENEDEVMYPNPGFPIYESMIKFVGAKPVPMQLKEENDFALDTEDTLAKINDRTRMIILNFPENPTGGVLTNENLEAIAEKVKHRRDLIVISDEVYSRIIYEGEHRSIASLPGMRDKTVVIDGFSKTYAMTGWRIGYGVMPEPLAQRIAQLMINSNSCTCAFSQMAGVEALTGPQNAVDDMVAEFRRRRETIVTGLNKIDGISCKKPKATFYAFPNVKNVKIPGEDLPGFLLEEAGVATLGGTSFGAFGGGYVRFSFANSIPNLEKALARTNEALSNL